MFGLFNRWWEDPTASSSLAIAIIAAVFAIYQLRAIPRERRRRILDSMVDQYGETVDDRGRILRECPSLMRTAYEEIKMEVAAEIDRYRDLVQTRDPEAEAAAEHQIQHLEKLLREANIWTTAEIGLSYTNAAEILSSEFKFRAIFWCIEILRDPEERERHGITNDILEVSGRLVNNLNNFALNYENGTYPPRTLMGQLHRSIAPAAKALEPIIWWRSINGRWGRRVLRLGIASQHYNDVVRAHRSTDLVWRSPLDASERIVVHPARTINVFGKEVLRINVPGQPRLLPILRLYLQSAYWRAVGILGPRPTLSVWSYGGIRLRRHRRREDQLSAYLRFGIGNIAAKDGLISMSFSWDMSTLRAGVRKLAKAANSAHPGGRTRWLWNSSGRV